MSDIVTKERLEWMMGGIEWEKLSDSQLILIESLEMYAGKHGALTDKQSAVIESIYKCSQMEHNSWSTPEERREKRMNKCRSSRR